MGLPAPGIESARVARRVRSDGGVYLPATVLVKARRRNSLVLNVDDEVVIHT
jgi:hypothetical protein